MRFFRKSAKYISMFLLSICLVSGLLMPIKNAKAFNTGKTVWAETMLVSLLLSSGVQLSGTVTEVINDIFTNVDSSGRALLDSLNKKFQLAKASGMVLWEVTKQELLSFRSLLANLGVTAETGEITGTKYPDVNVGTIADGDISDFDSSFFSHLCWVYSVNNNVGKNLISEYCSNPYMYFWKKEGSDLVFIRTPKPLVYMPEDKTLRLASGDSFSYILLYYGEAYATSGNNYGKWASQFYGSASGLVVSTVASNCTVYTLKDVTTGSNAITYVHTYHYNEAVSDVITGNVSGDSISLNIPTAENPTLKDVVGSDVAGEFGDNVLIGAGGGVVNPPIDPPINPPAQSWYDEVITSAASIATAVAGVTTAVGSSATTITDALTNASTAVKDMVTSIPKDTTLNFDKFKNLVVFDKFPFCIPFDFIKAIKLFAKTASDYQFKIDLETSYFKIHHTIDLTPFAIPIGFFRYICVVWFSIILISKTRDLMKW